MRLFQKVCAVFALIAGLFLLFMGEEVIGAFAVIMSYLWTIADDIELLKEKLGVK